MKDTKGLWCTNQVVEKDTENIMCIAHIAEARVFDCPYSSNEERKESEYPCSDYEVKQ